MYKQDRFRPPAMGGSALLAVFAVLCLTVFALLSLSAVQAERRLGDAAEEAVRSYYAADAQAEEILARLRRGETVDGVQESDGVLSYGCPISEEQELSVELCREGERYTVLRWQAVSTVEWRGEEHWELWDGTVPD